MEVVATADTVNDAVRQAAQLQPDIVLLDVSGESGISEAVQRILDHCPRTVVVLLDDASFDANVREVLNTGARGYLTKQQPFEQIVTALRKAARGDRVFAPEIARRLVLSAEGVRLSVVNGDHPLARLTPRETDVLIHLAQGRSVKQCAENLGIGASTVGNHKSRLMKKLKVHKTVELVHLAMREGLVNGPAAARYRHRVESQQ